MYEAFFSTKVDGLGIGLRLCRSIIESHQGRIKAVNLYNGDDPHRLPLLVHAAGRHHRLRRHRMSRRRSVPAAVTRMSLIPKRGTVYVVDDDEAVRDSLQWLLEGKDYRVKCFDSAESFLARFDPREVACLIADIRMDGMSGLELQDKLLERRSPLPVTFITGHGDVPMAVTTMKKGAEDFIEKPFKEDELVALVEKMLERARVDFSKHQEAASRDALLSRLTTREAQVLERIVAGRLNKQIADDLGISIKTVEAHRANIMEKLNANTVADLLKIALGAQARLDHRGSGSTAPRIAPAAPRRARRPRRPARLAGRTARPGRHPGRRRPGQPGLRPQQGQGLRRGRHPLDPGETTRPTSREAELLARIARPQCRPAVHGILVQMPLPQADRRRTRSSRRSPPRKDVDGYRSRAPAA